MQNPDYNNWTEKQLEHAKSVLESLLNKGEITPVQANKLAKIKIALKQIHNARMLW